MTSREFCYWLQGYFEINSATQVVSISSSQAQVIKQHLALVFTHEIDPSYGDKDKQELLNKIHAMTPIQFSDPPYDNPDTAIVRC